MSCDKFEELFTQETENELLDHIQSCEICMLEYKKMQKTQNLIKEVKPFILEQRRKTALTKVAASMVLVAISSFVMLNSFNTTKICYNQPSSTSIPVDEYGLLDIQ